MTYVPITNAVYNQFDPATESGENTYEKITWI